LKYIKKIIKDYFRNNKVYCKTCVYYYLDSQTNEKKCWHENNLLDTPFEQVNQLIEKVNKNNNCSLFKKNIYENFIK